MLDPKTWFTPRGFGSGNGFVPQFGPEPPRRRSGSYFETPASSVKAQMLRVVGTRRDGLRARALAAGFVKQRGRWVAITRATRAA